MPVLRVCIPGGSSAPFTNTSHIWHPSYCKPRAGRKKGRRGQSPDGQVAWCSRKSTGSIIHSCEILARSFNFSGLVFSSTIKMGLKIISVSRADEEWGEECLGEGLFAILVRGGKNERKWGLEGMVLRGTSKIPLCLGCQESIIVGPVGKQWGAWEFLSSWQHRALAAKDMERAHSPRGPRFTRGKMWAVFSLTRVTVRPRWGL